MTTTLHSPRTQAFADLPPPLGAIVAGYRIATGEAIAYPVTAGQVIQITVGPLAAFDPTKSRVRL